MRAWIGSFLGLAGLACGLTLVYLCMRAVMEVGGACADGGPYVSAQPCPEGVPVLMLLGIFGSLISLGIFVWGASALGGGYAALALWAWPALFLSLGWNFLEYGFSPPEGMEGGEAGWIVCGVLFWLMGGLPALFGLRTLPRTLWPAAKAATASPSSVPAWQPSTFSGAEMRERSRTVFGSSSAVPAPPVFDGVPPPSMRVPDAGDVVAKLERLAALRTKGDLTDDQYEQAKKAVLAGD